MVKGPLASIEVSLETIEVNDNDVVLVRLASTEVPSGSVAWQVRDTLLEAFAKHGLHNVMIVMTAEIDITVPPVHTLAEIRDGTGWAPGQRFLAIPPP